jgi:hypothetical protein
MSPSIRRAVIGCALACALLLPSRPADAYSVLAHEAMVDAMWSSTIVPLLRERFPRITTQQIMAARRVCLRRLRHSRSRLLPLRQQSAREVAGKEGRGDEHRSRYYQPPARTYNPLVEETYAHLVDTLAKAKVTVPRGLRADLMRHYSAPLATAALTRRERKLEEKARRQLETIAADNR